MYNKLNLKKVGKGMEEEKQLRKKEFILEGLDCANCAMKIENGIASINGVRECTVNFATQTLQLQVDEIEEKSILAKAEKNNFKTRTTCEDGRKEEKGYFSIS
ncbi:hypothetical protein HLK66_20325 [Niallia circulans]|nr:hypothetical protein HLK66_20325 [Niallia circulans]